MEHVVDWRFEGETCEDLSDVHGPTLMEEAGRLLDLLAQGEAEDLGGPLELSILLTDDGGIRPLNAQWRGKDQPTDVLSFPLDEGPVLGDVVLSLETAARRVQGDWTLDDELLFLLLHGVLHLLGHDHEEEGERTTMEAAEQALWTALGRVGTLREPGDTGA